MKRREILAAGATLLAAPPWLAPKARGPHAAPSGWLPSSHRAGWLTPYRA